MRGNLTIDKSSMNMSYFLYTLKIINDNGGKVTRKQFGKEMGDFIGIPSVKNGRENRTPYNKSKLPRYFGFVDTESTASESYLVLTNRGKALLPYIACRPNVEADEMYYVSLEHRSDFIRLLFNSVCFDTFGKNNCGAETSHTDVEPPKIVFKTIKQLGKATAEEICFVLYGLNNGLFNTFDEAILAVETNRRHQSYNYTPYMEKWDIVNIAHDCKIINIFTSTSIQLLKSERDNDGHLFYRLNDKYINNAYLHAIDSMKPVYAPINTFVHYDTSAELTTKWIMQTILGRVSDSSMVIITKPTEEPFVGTTLSTGWSAGVFEKTLLQAFRHPEKNVFMIIDSSTPEQLPKVFGPYSPLLSRIYDLSSDENGMSLNSVVAPDAYRFLTKNTWGIASQLPSNSIRIPSNLNFITILKE